ncbi:MAG: S26 family signal peptidase [Micromonosporaceae bacterium]|jgi:signal peptidase I
MTWLLIGVAGVATLAATVVLLARRHLMIFTVDGVSMLPVLEPGERILVHLSRRRIERGRIVLLQRPDPDRGWNDLPVPRRALNTQQWYVKRIAAVAGDPIPEQVAVEGVVPAGYLVVLGDHPYSIDSRQHGLCPVEQVVGVMVGRLSTRHRSAAS